MTRSKDDERKDQLSLELSGFVDGWELDDVQFVCAGISAAAIGMAYDDPEVRRARLKLICKFMLSALETMEAAAAEGEKQ